MQNNDRLTAPVREHLDVAPAYAADAGPQRLHSGFLRGEARGQLLHAPAITLALSVGVDALQETLTMAIKHPADARDLDYVNADLDLSGRLSVPDWDVLSARH